MLVVIIIITIVVVLMMNTNIYIVPLHAPHIITPSSSSIVLKFLVLCLQAGLYPLDVYHEGIC